MSNRTEIKDIKEAKERLEKLLKSERITNPPMNIKPDINKNKK